MDSLFIDGKKSTPTINFNDEGVLSISGRSIPEHPLKFYKPIEDWLNEFLSQSPAKVHLIVYLDYLNTHSSECMLSIFKMLEKYYISSKTDVSVLWKFDEDDEDLQSLGEDLKSLVPQLSFGIQEIL